MIITYYTLYKKFIIFKMWNSRTLKIQNMFQDFKFQRVHYHIYMGAIYIHMYMYEKKEVYNT